MKRLPFKERSAFTHNPTAKKLFAIVEEKKSNLALSADFTSCDALLSCAESLGGEICVLKTHIDILEDFTPAFTSSLAHISKRENFLLFEDRKFADIGTTALAQYKKGIYRIAEWADITNAHILPGPGIIEGLQKGGLPLGRGLLLLAEMSSAGALTDKTYAEHAVALARQFSDFVIGFISQRRLIEDPRFLFLTPGIHLHKANDSLGQQYRSPKEAMASGSDILIVGRAICDAKDPKQEAALYARESWKAYVESLSA
ncbi:MAG TPA: orotidine-5'-phosphate decarboxylase [Rhabdochlamydiaceae bacterium]|jgi:uridine monophosphate synthetase